MRFNPTSLTVGLACGGSGSGQDSVSNTFDSRWKRLAGNQRFILINNFKCGFSSSNLLAWEPVTKIRGDDQVILFYRDVFMRAVSVFIN